MSNLIKITKPSKTKMCEPGFHVVRGHHRVCHSGTKTWVDAHIRKNRGRKAMYLKENLLFIYWNNKKIYGKLRKVYGFPPHHELDIPIQFWLNYWKSKGVKFPAGLKPLHIKILIAIESSFRPKARPKTSSAIGLMQLLKGARSALKGTENVKNNEVRNNYISVSEKQLEDPIVNIAVGVRWFAHKFYLMRNHKDQSLKTVIRNYHSKDKAGAQYAEKILKLYKVSK